MSDVIRLDWSKFDVYLGEVPDECLATLVSCSATTVKRRRKKLLVEPYQPNMIGIKWELYDSFLGKETDKAISVYIGCARSTVTMRRIKLGVTASTKSS